MTLLAERPAPISSATETITGNTAPGTTVRGGSYVTLPAGDAIVSSSASFSPPTGVPVC